MTEQILFDPPFPAPQIVGLGVFLALLTIVGYARAGNIVGRMKRFFLTLFRLTVIAGLTLILLRPMVMDVQRVDEARPVFTVLVDTSQSMNTTDVGDQSRLEAVLSSFTASESTFNRDLSAYYDVEFYTFSDDLKASTFRQLVRTETADGTTSDLTTALMNLGNASSLQKKAGILLVSDGRENAGGDVSRAAAHLKSLNIPVWTTAVGTTNETKDLYVTARLDQSFLYVNQSGTLKIDLSQAGYDGWYAKVEVLREGESLGIEQIMLRHGIERITFPLREETKGTYRYTVRVEPMKGESDTGNNERTVFVRAVDEQSKILLVEAQPYWDSKFLLRTLQADPNLEVTSIFHMNSKKIFAVTQKPANDGARAGTSPAIVRMPRTKQELFKYDVIILGKDMDVVFSADELRLLKAYLEERGGSIIFARGKSYSFRNDIISQIEPVVWDSGSVENVRLELTSAGIVNPIFNFGQAKGAPLIIRELPEMISIAKVKNEKTLAVVLAKGSSGRSAEEIAAIAYQRYGKGKVMSIGTAGLWRWAFMPKDLDRYDAIYARFWGQMIRWLVYGSDFLPGQDISFRTDKHAYSLGEVVPLVIQTKFVDPDAFQPRIELIPPVGSPVLIQPELDLGAAGFYSASFAPDQEGEYEAVLYDGATDTVHGTVQFTAYSDSVEKRFVASNEPLMDQISEITSGEPLTMAQWHELPDLVRNFELSLREETKPRDIWDKLKVFAALIALLAIEWVTRRRAGLI